MPSLKSPEILETPPLRHLRSAGDLPIWLSKVDRQEQLRTFFDAGVGQVGNDMGEAAMSGAEAAAPMVGDAAQAGASAAMSGAQAAAPMVQDAASSAASAVMSGAQSAAPMVGDAATALASNLGDAASNIGGDDNGCFPASAMVMGRQGPIRMEELRLGDELECAPGDFSPVIAMLHRSPGTKMTYLRIHHDHGSLAVSANHLLYICPKPGADAGSWQWAAAAAVRPGDLLQHATEFAAVLSVSVEAESGIFAPLTLCSTLLVDGVLCSCFAPPEEFCLSHSLCHCALAPLRFWYYARRSLEVSTQLGPCLPLPRSTLHPYADTLLFAFRTLRWESRLSTV